MDETPWRITYFYNAREASLHFYFPLEAYPFN